MPSIRNIAPAPSPPPRPLPRSAASPSVRCYRVGCRHWWSLVGLAWLLVLATFGSGTAFGYFTNASRDAAECLNVVGDEPDEASGRADADDVADDGEDGNTLEEASAGDATAEPHSVSYILAEEDTLYEALTQFGVPPALVREWETVARAIYPLSKVHAGQSFELYYFEPDRFQGLTFHIGVRKHLRLTREGDGWRSELDESEQAPPPPQGGAAPAMVPVAFHYENGIPVVDDLNGEAVAADTQPHLRLTAPPRNVVTLPGGARLYQGPITNNFYDSALAAGMAPPEIMTLIDLFGAAIDFRRDFRPGDRFQALLGVPDSGGGARVLAAMIEAGHRPHWAIYFRDGSRGSSYYDEEGRGLRGFTLNSPVPGARVTSGYTHRRYHPILHYYRPHLAVDYSARTGTPIRAPAAGVIEYAGRKGDYGRYLSLRHNSTYTTTYGHLSRFGSGIHRGVRVNAGQIIGYVGSTGLSTGPHLCYRVLKHGKSINPLSFRGTAGPSVANPRDFQRVKTQYQTQLSAARSAPTKLARQDD